MTVQEWLTSRNPEFMLAALDGGGRFSERKARLFATAVVRRVWHLLGAGINRERVEVAERYVDDLVSPDELEPYRCLPDSLHDWNEDLAATTDYAAWCILTSAHAAKEAVHLTARAIHLATKS